VPLEYLADCRLEMEAEAAEEECEKEEKEGTRKEEEENVREKLTKEDEVYQ